ncbi:BMP family ABC transporter substrate-binding protein [Streptomyces sp. NPDC051041]|uniref:BMP family ABC transporter substrate-binding protein n=1 Tax=Streptomyces sp. NPDC051041 TaxID=3365640 RepID=UPI0037B99388
MTAVVTGALRGRRGWAATGGAAAVALALAGMWLFDGEQAGPPDPRARQYTEVDACLLTGEKGILPGTPAAPVWKGMQEASLRTRARVNYVPVTGPQSVDNVRPFFNSLVQRRCEVVLAVGDAQVRVTRSDAGKHPEVRFVLVGDEVSGGGNVVVVKPDAQLAESVADAVRRAVREVEK